MSPFQGCRYRLILIFYNHDIPSGLIHNFILLTYRDDKIFAIYYYFYNQSIHSGLILEFHLISYFITRCL